MRRACATALAIALVALAPSASAAEPDRALERYAKATRASFVVMTDESSGVPNGVLTPHAAFLVLRCRPHHTMAKLACLEANPACSAGGASPTRFNVQTRFVSPAYLSLDQGMIMAALGNELGRDVLRRAFATPGMRRSTPAGAGRRGVQRRAARLHDHGHPGCRSAQGCTRRGRHLWARRT